ncbi:MAG: DeoR/GlpR family DNA-binding transcription regulator [Paracoccaceae bacterium]
MIRVYTCIHPSEPRRNQWSRWSFELLYHKKLMVITNNLNGANILRDYHDSDIVITGGNLRRSDGGLIGDTAIETISRFKFDIAIIGCSAIDQDGDMVDYDMQEISVSQNIIKQSRKVFLVADNTKFQRKAPIKIASLSDVDCIFTDKPLDESLQHACRA